jgi:ribonuclease BN (tRNA processing enzyme)
MSRFFLTPLALLACGLPGLAHAGAGTVAPDGCGQAGVWLQVLGSGGPEIADGRASSGYLVWQDGRARLLVDAGAGVALRFGEAGAAFADLDAILFSHTHVDHVADLAPLVKASWFGPRRRDLPLVGPSGSPFTVDVRTLAGRLFASDGVYPYLDGFLAPDGGRYRLAPRVLDVADTAIRRDVLGGPGGLRAAAVPVDHGPIPALAWRVDIGAATVVFTGDTTNRTARIGALAGSDTEVLVAHHAIPEHAGGAAAKLHMPPSQIGRLAALVDPDLLVLSHRMRRTLGRERESVALIREHYDGDLRLASDLACFEVTAPVTR